jgi:DNA repair and recombination protein RAD54B
MNSTVEEISSGQGAILADEMGLGKTLQVITLIWTLLRQSPFENIALHTANPSKGVQGMFSKILIVCPVTLVNNWKKEFRKWLGSERLGVLAVDENTNMKDFNAGRVYSVMIIGYERVKPVFMMLIIGSNGFR